MRRRAGHWTKEQNGDRLRGLCARIWAATPVVQAFQERAVRLGRRVMHVARQGIWVGMGLSVIAMLFAAFGFISPASGAILQEGIDVIAILNALRRGRISLS